MAGQTQKDLYSDPYKIKHVVYPPTASNEMTNVIEFSIFERNTFLLDRARENNSSLIGEIADEVWETIKKGGDALKEFDWDRLGKILSAGSLRNAGQNSTFFKNVANIKLFVPENVTFSDTQNYDDYNIFSSGFGDPTRAAFGQIITGYTTNPIVEVTYQQPNLRRFQFDFNFAPANPLEAFIINGPMADKSTGGFVRLMRYHQAPGQAITGIPVAMIPPSVFQIRFLKKDKNGQYNENPYVYKIKNCVLDNVDVSMTPDNLFVTHADGMPSYIRTQFQFREVEFITKELILQGY